MMALPVLLTLAMTVSKSNGERVRTSMTSAWATFSASNSWAASLTVRTWAPQAMRVRWLPSRTMRALPSGMLYGSSGTSVLIAR